MQLFVIVKKQKRCHLQIIFRVKKYYFFRPKNDTKLHNNWAKSGRIRPKKMAAPEISRPPPNHCSTFVRNVPETATAEKKFRQKKIRHPRLEFF
jgi:hypothetical protein